jgi:hypothetical protein
MSLPNFPNDEFLKEIGSITISFSNLEDEFHLLAIKLLGVGDVGNVVTAELSFRALRVLIQNIYFKRFNEDENWQQLKELMEETGTKEEKRNNYVHSSWGFSPHDSSLHRSKMTAKGKDKGYKIQLEVISIEHLKSFVEEIQTLSKKICEFTNLLPISI